MAEPKNLFTTFLYPLFGVILLTVGCYWIYRPLGPTVLGILLLSLAFLGKK
jgi:hypothetical protein